MLGIASPVDGASEREEPLLDASERARGALEGLEVIVMRGSPILVLALALGSVQLAHADSMPTCPPGEHWVSNPTQPGAMHHGGFHCEPDAPPPSTVAPPPSTVAPPPSTVAPPPSTVAPPVPPPPSTAADSPASADGAPAESSMCSAAISSRDHAALALVLVTVLALARRRRARA